MIYVSGETTYIPPPLAKGEILTGLAGFLENDNVKKRPRALDIYGPYHDQDELEIDLLGAKSTAMPRTAKSTRRPSDKSKNSYPYGDGGSDSEEDQSVEQEGEDVGVAFDVERLPFAYGTKTTELLIDALFNPVRITEKKDESPFTIYVPPSPPSRNRSEIGIGLGLSGVVMDRPGATLSTAGGLTHPRRQQSTSSSVYTTTSTTSSTGSRAETSESGHRSQSHQDAAASIAHDSPKRSGTVLVGPPPVPHVKSTPEGRVVVGPAQEEQIGVVRAWWRKRLRPPPPLMPTAQT